MRIFLALLILCFFSYPVFSQSPNTGKISGKVMDGSQKPIEYATITLKDKTGKTVNGTVTNAKGVFEIKAVATGIYIMSIDFIGYTTYQADSIKIDNNNSQVTLNTISLISSKQTLKEVVVTSKAPIIENKIDKIVYNAANDITAQGGVAIDVLKKVPMVSVDIDGNVELQGSSSIRFLINGKPSSMFGNNLADALASIPASQIKSIEAITTPGAKYDAQGTGGIINIILKDSKVQGYNGSISIGAGTRLENASVNLNVRHNNFGVNAFFSGNAQLRSHTPNQYSRISSDTAGKRNITLEQDGYSEFKRNGFQSGIGFDYAINKKNNLSGSLGFNHNENDGYGITNQQQLTKDYTGASLGNILSTRNSLSHSGSNNFDWQLNYKKKFKKEGQELDIAYNSVAGNPNAHYSQEQTYTGQPNPYTGSYSDNPGKDRETEIGIDYAHPVTDEFLIETGLKTVWNDINSSADVFALNAATNKYSVDPKQSYTLQYSRKIYAGYLSTNFSIGKALSVKAGFRVEHTDTKIDFPGTNIPSYNSYVPSVIFSHKFENGNVIKLAYSHRIERPDYREINPFQNLSDPYNITTGNPLLKPEIGDNFELGFNHSFEKGGSIYISIASRFNSDDIKPYTVYYPTYKIGDSLYSNVSVSTRMNIGLENRTGLNISGSIPVTRQLNLRTNIFLSNRRIVNKLVSNNVTNGFDGRINLNASYQLPHDLALEGFVNYNSSVNNIQGKQPQFISYTFAFRKFWLNKKASIGFTATNPFSKYITQETTIVAANYNSINIRQVPYQSFGISLSYKFGKLEFKKSKEDDNSFLSNPPSGGN